MKYALLIIILISSTAVYGQTAQWRGPARDGIYPDTGLLKVWPEEGPALVMTVRNLGEGFSSAVEANGIIYVTGKKEKKDYLSAIDSEGQILWQVSFGDAWKRSHSSSRATPTVDGDRIYVMSGMGRLACMDAQSGKEIWAKDVDKDFEAEYHLFGFTESPLIVDDMVISVPAGKKTTMIALNKLTGELIWQSKSLDQSRAYASPILYEHEDLRLILGFTSKDLVAANPKDGRIIWTYPYYKHSVEKGVEKRGINMTNTPIFKDREIFITSGYNCPAVMLTLSEDGTSVREKWINPTLDCHHHGVVLVDDYIYGSNYYNNRFGKWVCLDWDTGEVRYVVEWENKGSMIAADGMLYVYEEKNGHVALVKPDPDGFEPASVFTMNEGKGPHWAHPSIYNGKLMIRHADILQVYNIKE